MKEFNELRKKYLASDGALCPHCGSNDLIGGQLDISMGEVWQDITCNNCKKKWCDIYTLSDMGELI